nr:MAG TPA: hypothetical protein [Caudoviricetes sp.]
MVCGLSADRGHCVICRASERPLPKSCTSLA